MGKHLDPAIPTKDLERLVAAAEAVKYWVDKCIAHSDASAVRASATLTFTDIHAAIDAIGEVFQR